MHAGKSGATLESRARARLPRTVNPARRPSQIARVAPESESSPTPAPRRAEKDEAQHPGAFPETRRSLGQQRPFRPSETIPSARQITATAIREAHPVSPAAPRSLRHPFDPPIRPCAAPPALPRAAQPSKRAALRIRSAAAYFAHATTAAIPRRSDTTANSQIGPAPLKQPSAGIGRAVADPFRIGFSVPQRFRARLADSTSIRRRNSPARRREVQTQRQKPPPGGEARERSAAQLLPSVICPEKSGVQVQSLLKANPTAIIRGWLVDWQ